VEWVPATILLDIAREEYEKHVAGLEEELAVLYRTLEEYNQRA
jgi:hypothetical protein